ncbi:MAG: hypothetical protein ACE1Y4_01780, partial [Lysobacterales bacterium]
RCAACYAELQKDLKLKNTGSIIMGPMETPSRYREYEKRQSGKQETTGVRSDHWGRMARTQVAGW